SGELTLARVLRQLPQNINATNETYGSTLNGADNLTGASTVNLRGLGSESTLILVDGRRVGYSGIFGGVTDISTIPLSMVERIEILLDGASAVYGSDAVGGVVNIITRKDYSGVELNLNYGRPHKSGYHETRASLSTGFAWEGGRANVGFENFRDSGLDASERDTIVEPNRDDTGSQQRGLAGPQVRLYSYFFDRDYCQADQAIVYELDGSILNRNEFAALEADRQAKATCHADITVPAGFMPGNDLSGIEIFGPPRWGEDAEFGRSLRPKQNHNVLNVAVEQAITDSITAHATIRWGKKNSTSNQGLNAFSGTLNEKNPFNPFMVPSTRFNPVTGIGATSLTVSGQILNAPPTSFESEGDQLFTRIGLEGSFGGSWTWQAEFSRSEEEVASQRLNVLDSQAVRDGINSDGVTESRIASLSQLTADQCEAERASRGGTRVTYRELSFGRFVGLCSIFGAPPDPINPFGDLSSFVTSGLNSGSQNEQTQFEALARGELFNMPGGAIALVVGYDYREDVLDSFSEFQPRGSCSVIACSGASGSPAGAAAFNTRIGRTTQAGFLEGLIPLVGSNNAMSGIQRLSLTFSGRYDSYSNVEVEYRESQSGEAGTDNPADPGSEFTYSTGLVYQVNDSLRFKANRQTSFVAPQLNQLIQRTQDRALGGNFDRLRFREPDGSLSAPFVNTYLINGANDELKPETAESITLTAEISPPFLPGVFLRAAWSDTEFKDRIFLLGSSPIVDRDNLPGNIIYIEEEDSYLIDRRWINVASINRSGIDYELRYDWEMGANDFSIVARRSYTNQYEVQRDPSEDAVIALVTTRDDSGPQNIRWVPPVPRHKSSLQFTWSNGGLFASLDVEGAARTSRVDRVNERVTVPKTNYDLVLGYEFGSDTFFDAPAWMDGLSSTLTINNLTNAFAENYTRHLATGEISEYGINPFYEWTQGRAYRFAVNKSF
ncbi:MAG: TonB-dependent receptor, partial [Gammaproteobacteria bacterium]|nr:TonB-dependent receptor [Gammaproteobacteria bacterium]